MKKEQLELVKKIKNTVAELVREHDFHNSTPALQGYYMDKWKERFMPLIEELCNPKTCATCRWRFDGGCDNPSSLVYQRGVEIYKHQFGCTYYQEEENKNEPKI